MKFKKPISLCCLFLTALMLVSLWGCSSSPSPTPTPGGLNKPTPAPTDAEDPTEAPTTDPETPDETKPEKKGCKSTIGLTALLTVVGAAWVIRKKRED